MEGEAELAEMLGEPAAPESKKRTAEEAELGGVQLPALAERVRRTPIRNSGRSGVPRASDKKQPSDPEREEAIAAQMLLLLSSLLLGAEPPPVLRRPLPHHAAATPLSSVLDGLARARAAAGGGGGAPARILALPPDLAEQLRRAAARWRRGRRRPPRRRPPPRRPPPPPPAPPLKLGCDGATTALRNIEALMAELRERARALAAEHAQNANALGWVMQKTLASLANPRQFVETLMDPRASRLIGAFHADLELLPKSASCGADDAPPAPPPARKIGQTTR